MSAERIEDTPWYLSIHQPYSVGYKTFRVLGLSKPYLVELSGCAEVWQPGWNQSHACNEFSPDGKTELSSPIFSNPSLARYQHREPARFDRLADPLPSSDLARVTALLIYPSASSSSEPNLVRPKEAKIVALLTEEQAPKETSPPYGLLSALYQVSLVKIEEANLFAANYGSLMPKVDDAHSISPWSEYQQLALQAVNHFATVLADPHAKVILQNAAVSLLPSLLFAAHLGDDRSVDTISNWVAMGNRGLSEAGEFIEGIAQNCGLLYEVKTDSFFPSPSVCPLDPDQINQVRAILNNLKNSAHTEGDKPRPLDVLFLLQALLFQIPSHIPVLAAFSHYLQVPPAPESALLSEPLVSFSPVQKAVLDLATLATESGPYISISPFTPTSLHVLHFLQHHLYAACLNPLFTMDEFHTWFKSNDTGFDQVIQIIHAQQLALLKTKPYSLAYTQSGGGEINDIRDVILVLNHSRSLVSPAAINVAKTIVANLPNSKQHPYQVIRDYLAKNPSSSVAA